MPVDRGAIDAQLRDIGEGERWWEQREFRELPYILHTDERIHGLTVGWLLGARRPRLLSASSWLIVATNQRLICLQQERFGRKQAEIPLGQIVGLQHRGRMRSYQITIHIPHHRYRIRIPKADAFRFIGALVPLVPQLAARPQSAAADAVSWLPGADALAALPGLSLLAPGISVLQVPDPVTRDDLARVEGTVERLEREVERLQQQVEFLENLLQRRAEGALSLPGRSAEP